MSGFSHPPWRDQHAQTERPFRRNGPANPRKRPADTQERAWVADEDRFVLRQAKKKAQLRVKESRGKPVDWLAVMLTFLDPTNNPLDEDISSSDLDVADPEAVFDKLDDQELEELDKDIDMYRTLEEVKPNLDYWATMHTICRDRRQKRASQYSRGAEAVSADVDKLFNSKTVEQLEALEKQISTKLKSDAAIDIDYWQSLLGSLQSWKARAKLRRLSQALIDSRLESFREQQAQQAAKIKAAANPGADSTQLPTQADAEPSLKIAPPDKHLAVQDEREFLASIGRDRQRVLKAGYIAASRGPPGLTNEPKQPPKTHAVSETSQLSAQYEREAARGLGEDEEVFRGEEEVATAGKHKWQDVHRPRKPRYFNRVQMGYEWNKYNQTHYDHDNPPPKVVQGYKFNIFYPELVDKTKAPTYKIEREHGRRRGESFAQAGQEDTCLLRFIAGAPYEDIAFRIVDREWDYSAKRERGFRSSFERGVLQLHFQFKKVFYRK